VWRHGDWIEIAPDGACVITGRSDATLNRGGVRMGTSEFYSVVEAVPGWRTAWWCTTRTPPADRASSCCSSCSTPATTSTTTFRHGWPPPSGRSSRPGTCPTRCTACPAMPRTISGKKLEVPVKRLLDGEPLERVVNPGAMANPDSLQPFLTLAAPRGR
jgi:acetoacetyl-CoA synthetase